MSPEQRDPAFLWDMLDAARKVVDFTRGLDRDAYLESLVTRMAVERALEVLGESARSVSVTFRAAHPEVPWRDLIGQRNVLAHEYGEIDHERVWIATTQEAPKLVETVESLVPPSPDRA